MAAARARRALAAIALAAFAAGAGASDLGTLFHTPSERARLDKLRRGESPEAPAAVNAPTSNPELTGYVQRSDGRNTVWIDGIPVPVASPKAKPLFDPRAVRDYGERANNGSVRIERKDPVKR